MPLGTNPNAPQPYYDDVTGQWIQPGSWQDTQHQMYLERNGLPSNSSSSTTKTYADFNGDWRAYLEYMADQGDAASIDKLVNYLQGEESADRARSWTAGREDTQYQRLVADLKAAGINPYILLNSGAQPISSASSGNSYNGSQFTTVASQKEKERHDKETESVAWLRSLLAIIPFIIALAI